MADVPSGLSLTPPQETEKSTVRPPSYIVAAATASQPAILVTRNPEARAEASTCAASRCHGDAPTRPAAAVGARAQC
jgi:hypothetical protein